MRTTRDDRGQATVEFALLLPVVVLLALLVVQVGAIVHAQLVLVHAARDGARAAAFADSGAAARAVADVLDGPGRASVSVSEPNGRVRGEAVTVRVGAVHHVALPFGLGFDLTLVARATMMIENGRDP